MVFQKIVARRNRTRTTMAALDTEHKAAPCPVTNTCCSRAPNPCSPPAARVRRCQALSFAVRGVARARAPRPPRAPSWRAPARQPAARCRGIVGHERPTAGRAAWSRRRQCRMAGSSVGFTCGAFSGTILDNIANAHRQGAGFNPLRCNGGSNIFDDGAVGLNFEHVFSGEKADGHIWLTSPRGPTAACSSSPTSLASSSCDIRQPAQPGASSRQ